MELIGPPLSPLSRSLRRGERWRQTSPTYIYYYYCYYNDTSRPPSLFVILTRLHVYHNHHRQGGNTYCNRTLIRFPQLPTSTFTTVAAAAKDLLPPTSSSAVGEYKKGRTFLRHLSSEREREREGFPRCVFKRDEGDRNMEGWLQLVRCNRLGLHYTRKRYFVLEGNALNCYKGVPASDREVLGTPPPRISPLISWFVLSYSFRPFRSRKERNMRFCLFRLDKERERKIF